MSAPERRTLLLALLFLTVGWGARLLPTLICDNCDALSFVDAMPGSDEEIATDRGSISTTSGTESTTSFADGSGQRKSHMPSAHSSRRPKTKLGSSPVHVNRASEADLQAIKGVGPVLAKRIVEYRSQHGRFTGPHDFDQVQGIGKKKLYNLLPFLIFD